VKKQQIILVGSAAMLLIALWVFGNTTPPKKPASNRANEAAARPVNALSTGEVIAQMKAQLAPEQLQTLAQLEKDTASIIDKNIKIKKYDSLAAFWKNNAQLPLLGAYYEGEIGKLENSKKRLTFAARLLLNYVMVEDNPSLQTWMAINAKSLFERVVELEPANDSAKIGIGACYMFGNISNNPMQGILSVREIAEKNPGNLYAQMVLGLGGLKSGQYDNAVKRFSIVAEKQPDNVEAILNLAEAYERKGDAANAITWYAKAEKLIAIPEAKTEIENRIKVLQK
jgi:tetratricopeptide (TPR) repeat protein